MGKFISVYNSETKKRSTFNIDHIVSIHLEGVSVRVFTTHSETEIKTDSEKNSKAIYDFFLEKLNEMTEY